MRRDISLNVKHRLQCLHESFSTIPFGVKVVITSIISAATKASKIILADYTTSCLKYLQHWLNNEPKALDWSRYFSYIVQELEGKEQNEVAERQSQVRRLVKAVVHCDIKKNPAIERGFHGPYDVICSLVLDGTASTEAEYTSDVFQLTKLVKPGGYILYYFVENRRGFYTVGERNFPSLYIRKEIIVKTFQNTGFFNISLSCSPDSLPDKAYVLLRGTRF